ncbi:MAG TPA: hypothetical protein VHJ34_01715 [Actinomycetota bacterium]|nr:hypothetical protein [Actinomycetota bacterium]
MRSGRLLTRGDERGSAAIEGPIAIVVAALFLACAMEVALALYGRNVVMSAAHEGARAAIELGRDPRHAIAIATSTVERAAGGLAGDVRVGVVTGELGGRPVVRVDVHAVVDPPGPVPFAFSVDARSVSAREVAPR